MTIKDSAIAANGIHGVFLSNSDVNDLAIQNSHLGEVRDGMGNVVFAGNAQAGFFDAGSTFTGVAFVDSDFNANGGDAGIEFFESTIKSGVVSLDDASVTFTTGFTLRTRKWSATAMTASSSTV